MLDDIERETTNSGPALSVIVPCFQEVRNVAPMVAALESALIGIDWEVIFVDDDSPDGTANAARLLAKSDSRVRCIRRVGRRGLSSAVIEGTLSSSAEFVAVIDGDLQHDEAILPAMLNAVNGGADIAVGSRHVGDGDATGLASSSRQRLSRVGISVAQKLAGAEVSDPMSGFFLLRQKLFEDLAYRLNGRGFKILLDLLLSSPAPLKLVEIPYRFRPRAAGESKLDILVMVQFAGQFVDRALGGVVPLRFISFALVGLFGMGVNLAVMEVGRVASLGFDRAQTLGTIVAMIANFELNNRLTYRTVKLRGARYWQGLALFLVVCGLGAIANIGIANALYRANSTGILASAIGSAIGVVWNYAISATLVWRV
ncbi:glycosyltransferase family 2 protein [Acidiphilium sp. PA]|uniref:glycosyltransferase n=1 Tax=Acidiphilium sp. PA TaxID=2871705 RepID=UPI0022435A84|nr:glycosyltransferase family 2 protein [Acidiphilium sp. PA]MCW8309382.1 glycosyltransferase family 2 protein [Acidiphilium sp. PA]